MTSRPALILGNPDSVFPTYLAAWWRKHDVETIIVTREWPGGSLTAAGVPVVSTREHEGVLKRAVLRMAAAVLHRLELLLRGVYRGRYRRAMGAEETHEPSIAGAVITALSVVPWVRRQDHRFVFGQEAFTFGLATALCRNAPRALMPWGGDIYMYAETTPVAHRMVRYALRSVDVVCPSSTEAGRHVRDRFDVPVDRVVPVSWGVDLERFPRADGEARDGIRARLGVSPGALVVTSIRRFCPPWGSEAVLGAFLKLARAAGRDLHFIVVGGQGTERYSQRAEAAVKAEGMASRFTIFVGQIGVETFAEAISVTDVFVSLMVERDMRSWSILQAAAAGGGPVLSDQPEYREMERRGFVAEFVPAGDVDAAVAAVERYLSDPTSIERAREQNRRYLAEHENHDRQMARLLSVMTGLGRGGGG